MTFTLPPHYRAAAAERERLYREGKAPQSCCRTSDEYRLDYLAAAAAERLQPEGGFQAVEAP